MSTGTEKKLVLSQAVSGVLFTVFLILHLGNTLLAPFGPELYNSFQSVIRIFYQHPIFEVIFVLAPLIAHAFAGIWLYILRKKWQRSISLRYKLQSWAGLFLLLVVFGHVLATRGVSYWYGAIPGFEGVSFSLWWIPAYFYPYYFLLFMAGLYHSTMGVTVLLKRWTKNRGAANRSFPVLVSIIGAIGVSFALLGFGGVLFNIDDPRDNDYARQYSELLDINLNRKGR